MTRNTNVGKSTRFCLPLYSSFGMASAKFLRTITMISWGPKGPEPWQTMLLSDHPSHAQNSTTFQSRRQQVTCRNPSEPPAWAHMACWLGLQVGKGEKCVIRLRPCARGTHPQIQKLSKFARLYAKDRFIGWWLALLKRAELSVWRTWLRPPPAQATDLQISHGGVGFILSLRGNSTPMSLDDRCTYICTQHRYIG
jgi:hypothetical protein